MVRNLLIVATDFPPNSGGISTYTLELARELSKLYNLTVLAPGAVKRNTNDKILPFKIVRTPPISVLRILFLFMYIPWLIRRENIDAVFHTVWPTAMISHFYHRLIPTPYFISVHCSEILDDKRTWRRRIKKYARRWRKAALNKARAIFPVSHYTAGLLTNFGILPKKIHVVHCGVNTQRFKPIEKSLSTGEPQKLLTVARLDLHKGHDRVLEALSKLKKQGYTPTYIVAGEGEEKENLVKLARELGIKDQVKFDGFISDRILPALYAQSDIYIMISREIPGRVDIIEGFGISFLEASASGIPVIAGNSGGVSDAVLDGKTGLLVEPENSIKIAQAIKLLLTNKDLAKQFGTEGRRWTTNEMNWKRAAQKIHTKIKSCF